MGFWDGVSNFFFGQSPDKYDPNSPLAQKATQENTYGATQNLQGLAGSAMGRQAPTMTAANAGGPFNGKAYTGQAYTGQAQRLDTGNYNQARAGQMGLASLLNQTANGRGPSGAAMAAQAQRDSGLSQAAALQAGRRGQSAAAGAKMGTLSSQMTNQQASQNEAIGRANEMATARGQLGNVYGQVAGQDIGVAGQNAGFGQQMSMFNAGQNQGMSQFNAGQQQGMSQFNAGQGQNMAQYNAGLQQQANIANQNANLNQQGLNQALALGANNQLMGQGANELQANQLNNEMNYSNLQPGGPGLFQSFIQQGGLTAPQFAHGGVVKGPQRVLVGEAGPEAIVSLNSIVDRPTLMDLGHEEPQVVIPLSPRRQSDRDHVTGLALSLQKGAGATDKAADGGIYYPQQPAGALGIGTRSTPDWNATTAAGWGSLIGGAIGKNIKDSAKEVGDIIKAKLADSGGSGMDPTSGGSGGGMGSMFGGLGGSGGAGGSAGGVDAISGVGALAAAAAHGGIFYNPMRKMR